MSPLPAVSDRAASSRRRRVCSWTLTSLAVALVASPIACGEPLVLDDSDAHDGGANESNDGSTADGATSSVPGSDGGVPTLDGGDGPPVPEHCTETAQQLLCDCGQRDSCTIDCRTQTKPCVITCFGGSSCTVYCKSGDEFVCTGPSTTCTVIKSGCSSNNGAKCLQG